MYLRYEDHHQPEDRQIVVGNASKLGKYTSSRVFIGMMN